jgi:hypothetical protein
LKAFAPAKPSEVRSRLSSTTAHRPGFNEVGAAQRTVMVVVGSALADPEIKLVSGMGGVATTGYLRIERKEKLPNQQDS